MLRISANNKYVYERWKTIVTQMIEKDPGSPKINRLRVIHLYECELNLFIGFYFRKLSQHLEDKNLLNPGTYGSRPNRRAIDPIIIDVTQTEIAMVKRRPLIKCNNNLKQCFDRLMSHLVQLNQQSYGLPSNIAKILGDFLQQAIYIIETAMGISERSYSHTREHGVFVTGQGSVVSMYSCLTMISRIIDAHMQRSHGAKYSDPTGSLRDIIIRVLGFVDDNNISNTGEKYETIQNILKKTQNDAQFWNDLITSSGARFELTKCFTQIIQFEFTMSGAPVVAPPTPDQTFIIKDCILNFDFRIKPISPYDTYSSLGTLQGISEKQEDQVNILMKKATAHNRALLHSTATRGQAWIHHKMCFIPSIGYPLPVCHISNKKLHLDDPQE